MKISTALDPHPQLQVLQVVITLFPILALLFDTIDGTLSDNVNWQRSYFQLNTLLS